MSYEGLWEQRNVKDIKAIHRFHIWYKMDQKVLDLSVELNFFNMDSVISPTEICITQD